MKDNEALRVLKDQTIKVKNNPFDLDETSVMPDMTFCSRKIEPSKPMKRKTTMDDNLSGFMDDQNKKVKGPAMTNTDEDFVVTPPDSCFDKQNDVETVNSNDKDGVSCSLSMRQGKKRDQANKYLANADDEVICLSDSNAVQSSVHIRNEIGSSIPDSEPGKPCS